MSRLRLTNRIVRACAIIILLSGSSVIAYQFYQKAYDDLPTFYWATHLAFDEKVSAYQPHYFQQIGFSLDRKIYPFLYPPPSLLLFSPFLLGDYEQCKLVFTACNLILWWFLVWLTYRLFCFHAGRVQSNIAALLIPVWLLCFMPIWDVFRTGQINLIVLICSIPLFFDAPLHRHQIINGVLLAVVIILKVYMLLALPILLIFNKRVMLMSAGLTLFLLCMLSLVLLPPGLWADWIELSRLSGGYGKQLPNLMTIPWNQSINGFFIRQFLNERILSGTTNWPIVIYICSGAVVAAMLYTMIRGLKNAVHGFALAMALVFLVVTLVAPLTWLHHFIFVIPAIVCCFAVLAGGDIAGSQTSKERLPMLWVSISVVLLGCPLLVHVLLPFLPSLDIVDKTVTLGMNLAASVPLLAAVVFFMTMCRVLVGRKLV